MRPSSRHALARRLDQRFASAYALTKCDFICIVSLFIASVIAFATLGYRRVIPMPPCTTPRAIIIGDVHGCARELRAMLRRVKPRAYCDRVYFTGDLIGKGPASIEALREVRALEAGGVYTTSLMGNHEAGFLRWLDARRSSSSSSSSISSSSSSSSKYDKERLEWATSLGSDELLWLRERPLYAELPAEYGLVSVVHAGMEPGVPAHLQRRDLMLTMRSLLKNGSGTDAPGKQPFYWKTGWAARWKGPTHLVFGHDARRRLQRHPYATGIDAGAAYGGKLTALVLKAASNASVATPPGQLLHGGKLIGVSGHKGSCAVEPTTKLKKEASEKKGVLMTT